MLLPAPGSQRPDIKGSVSSNLKAEYQSERSLIASSVWEVAGLPIHPPRAALARCRAKGFTLEVDGLGLTLVLLISPTGK